MKRFQRLTLTSILAIAVLAVPTILAAAKELATLTVSGPGINGALTLSDPQGLMQLQQYGFFETSALAKVPQDLGEGYMVTGHLNLDGKAVPFVQGIYYPAIAGEQGYVHFTGAFDGTTTKPASVDRWGVVSPAAAAAFSKMVAAEGLTLQMGVQPPAVHAVSVPVAPAAPAFLLLTALAGASAVMIASGVLIRKRRTSVQ